MIGSRISEVRLNGQDQEKSLNLHCTKGEGLAMAEMQAVALGRSRISQDSRAPVRVTFKPRQLIPALDTSPRQALETSEVFTRSGWHACGLSALSSPHPFGPFPSSTVLPPRGIGHISSGTSNNY